MLATQSFGFGRAAEQAKLLGAEVRELLQERGFPSVAAAGFGAPGVVVSYTSRPDIQSGKAFRDLGYQIAAGVPLQCDEGESFRSFRIGLFGLDKLGDRTRTVGLLTRALDQLQH
jgi:aspartate aminotransferase-like enzyme